MDLQILATTLSEKRVDDVTVVVVSVALLVVVVVAARFAFDADFRLFSRAFVVAELFRISYWSVCSWVCIPYKFEWFIMLSEL